MSSREHLFSDAQIEAAAAEIPTPFHLYSEAGIRETARAINGVFDWVEPVQGLGYVNYFAGKAMPNPWVQAILLEEGMGIDAASGPEIEVASAIGAKYPLIMFTSNNTAAAEYAEVHDAGAVINLDDITEVDVLQAALGGELPDLLSFRYRLDGQKTEGVNSIIGLPEDTKFGVPEDELEEAYSLAMERGVTRFGIHTMVASNVLDASQHVTTAEIVFKKVAELSGELGITFEFVNLGGGLGIPYRPEDEPVDYDVLRQGIQAAYEEHIVGNGLPPLRVVTEYGRHITGPNAVTVFHARSVDGAAPPNVGLDGSTASDNPRPAIYPDAYHGFSVVGRHVGEWIIQNLTGSLCEGNDWFAKNRELPAIRVGDLLAMHDTGAHVFPLTSNFNSKTRAGEYLLRTDGDIQEIRRPESRSDLYRHFDYPGL